MNDEEKEKNETKFAKKNPKRERNGSVNVLCIVNRCHYVYALALHNGKHIYRYT